MAGIQDLRYIDPMKMKFVRQQKKEDPRTRLDIGSKGPQESVVEPEIEEYFMYTAKPNYNSGMIAGNGGRKGSVKIAKDSVVYCSSGLVDRNKGTVLSYLHKAIKALNQLRMIEDLSLIHI